MWKNIAEVVNTFRGLGYFLTRCLDQSSPKKGWMRVKHHFVAALNGHTHFFFVQSNIYKQ